MDFPFDIADVAHILNLVIRKSHGNSMDTDCPFCHNDKKGKMNLHLEKNVFRCNYCGEHGGMIELYAKMHGISNSDAYNEVCQLLGENKQKPITHKNPILHVKESQRKNPDTLHQTYSMLLANLTLVPTHKKRLLARGLSEKHIEKYGFKSVPAFGQIEIAKKLMESGCDLEGVPGFYITDNDLWTINLNASGVIIPVLDMVGRIIGAQIRLDKPFDDKKYIWLSSTGKTKGSSSGAPIHFIGDPADKKVFITEGALKGYTAHSISGQTFICIPGANQPKHLPQLLETLKNNGTIEINEALDMDKEANTQVEKGAKFIRDLSLKLGFAVKNVVWNNDYKGIDDYYLFRRNDKQRKQEELLEQFF